MTEVKRTLFAGQAVGLAEVFKYTVGKERLNAGDVSYHLELSTPDGESTAGGKLAVQHIGMVADNGGGTLVLGTLYQVEKRAELRSFEQVCDNFQKRFNGAAFPVDSASYEGLLAKIETFLKSSKFQSQRLPPPAREAAPAPAPTPLRQTMSAASSAAGHAVARSASPARRAAARPANNRLPIIIASTVVLVAGVAALLLSR